MTSSDVRDVLNLGDSSGPRPSKKQKTSAVRPNVKGLAREVLNLGGGNPIAIVPQSTQFKKRRFASRKPAARWELRPFRNSGRDDQSLVLRHWRRKDMKDAPVAVEQAPQTGGANRQHEGQQPGHEEAPKAEELEDSTFAKFNVKVQVPQYSGDQYSVSLQNEDWTKEETDYLMEMASEFDLRWPIIWDRYEWTPSATNGETDADGDESKAVVPATRPRSMEDLKARYYEVAAKMMAAQKPVQYMTQQEYALHELMAHFNPKQEKLRKEFAMNTLSRSKEEAREEESLLLEIKRILARSERFNEERRELYNRLDYPRAETDINTFKSSAGMQTLLQNLMSVDKSKKRKSIMGADGVNTPSGGGGAAPGSTAGAAVGAGAATTTTMTGGAASGAQGGAQNPSTVPDSGKRDSVAASTAATRESTAATSTPTAASKKAQQQAEKQQPPERRKLTSQEEAVYGVTHHDRLGSGPTFRTEKINKLFSHKSNQQQLRINNALNELDVPAKLAMPTAATTLQYEQLLAAVNSLLDARKVSDKLDAEIKVEEAKRAEREKLHGPPPPPPTPPTPPSADADSEKKSEDDAAAKADGDKDAPISADQPDGKATSTTDDADETDDPRAQSAEATEEQAQDHKQDDGATKAGEADKTARPGSSRGAHKRSASVLSTVSDQSVKRQKK
ncbi:hypothetical protein EsDP_00001693 [Epichloe bromicola]|uniref:SWR1-complex protein 4 n=1 Tax=Epichloe bromicola TaxID=79588 RepID=A0ABQ0CIL1_9HYPO